jgi:hypothetical protein
VELIRIKLGFDNLFVVDCVGRSGGLALFWKSDTPVQIQNYRRRHINVVINSGSVGRNANLQVSIATPTLSIGWLHGHYFVIYQSLHQNLSSV